MQPYKDLGGNSGIAGYEHGSDYIRFWFKYGAVYLCTYSSAGAPNIETMKQLADSGQGLKTFINEKVRSAYKAKER